MLETLSNLLNIIVLFFAASSMLSVGFSYSIHEIIAPLRNVPEVAKALIANFVLVPILGYLLIHIFQMERPIEIGLILIACAAGAPFLIKLTIAAGTDVALSTSLLALLLPLTIVYMPLVVPIEVPEAKINSMAIATPLVLTMLVPLAIGFLLHAYFPKWTNLLQPVLSKLSSLALILLFAITFIVYYKAILGILGEGIILAAAILIIGAFGIGYLLGGPGIAAKHVLALGTAQRNISAATVVASQGFDDRRTLIVVILSSLLALILIFPIARLLRRQEK